MMNKLKFLVVLLLLGSTTSTITSTQKKLSSKIQDLIDLLETKEENTIKDLQVNSITRPKSSDSFLKKNNPLGKKTSPNNKNLLNQYKDNIASFPTVLWTNTLNFSYQYKDKKKKIITGSKKECNTFLVTTEGVLGTNKEENKELVSGQRKYKFDMCKIHQALQEEQEVFLKTKLGKKMKDNNHVVAGMSLIFEVENDNYEALFSMYRKDKKLYVFTSGQHNNKPEQVRKFGPYESVRAIYDTGCSPEYLYNNYITNRWKEKKPPNVIQNVINKTYEKRNDMGCK